MLIITMASVHVKGFYSLAWAAQAESHPSSGPLLKTSPIIGRDEAFMLHKKYSVVARDWLANSSSWVTLPSSNCF